MSATAKPQYHQSSLTSYEMCGYSYYLRVVEGLRGPNNMYAARGTGMHAGRERNFRQKVQSGTDCDPTECLDAARDAVVEACGETGVMLTDELEGLSKSAAQGVLVDNAVSLARVDRARLQPAIQPDEVEIEIAIDLADHPYALAMRLDSIDRDGYVTDLKSSKTKWSFDRAQSQYQPPTYLLGARTHTGKAFDTFRYNIVVITKAGKLSVQTIEVTPTPSQLTAVLSRFDAMHESIKAGIFNPCPAGHWKCSSRYCEYYTMCKYAQK